MKMYSDHVVTKETIEKLEDEIYTLKGMIFAAFVVNIVITLVAFFV